MKGAAPLLLPLCVAWTRIDLPIYLFPYKCFQSGEGNKKYKLIITEYSDIFLCKTSRNADSENVDYAICNHQHVALVRVQSMGNAVYNMC